MLKVTQNLPLVEEAKSDQTTSRKVLDEWGHLWSWPVPFVMVEHEVNHLTRTFAFNDYVGEHESHGLMAVAILEVTSRVTCFLEPVKAC